MLPEFGVSPRFSFQLPKSGGARGLKSGAANDGGFRTALSPLHLDSRLRGNDKWDVQRGLKSRRLAAQQAQEEYTSIRVPLTGAFDHGKRREDSLRD